MPFVPYSDPMARYFLAPHKNQTLAVRITDELIAALEEADGLETMSDFYREKYERGEFGNKALLTHLRALRASGVSRVEGTVMEHVDAVERTSTDGQRIMVIDDEDEDAVAWKGPWNDDRRGTILHPTDYELVEVEVVAETPVLACV